MTQTIVYILGLSHSGSTLLSLLLARLSGAVSVGESYAVLSGKQRALEGTEGMCSCQEELEKCELWSRVDRATSRFDVGYSELLREAKKLGYPVQ